MKNSKDSPGQNNNNSGKKSKFSFFSICCVPDSDPVPTNNHSQLAPISSMNRELQGSVSDRGSIHSKTSRHSIKSLANGIQSKASYPMNEVFILGHKYKMVAKITKIRVLKSGSKANEEPLSMGSPKKNSAKGDLQPKFLSRSSEDDVNYKKDIFSLYERGIKADEWDQITPEAIAKHIASRTKADIIIDALCGYGGNTIQFAKMSNFVIGIDIDPKKTIFAKENAEIYEVDHKIDFITADFLKMKNLSGEIVFINPSVVGYNSNSLPFSMKENLKPDLSNLLGKSLQISSCVCMKLPKEVSMDELVAFFHLTLETQELFSKRFCIEIEKIYNLDEELECLLIYFGDCSSIRAEQEQEAIYDYLAKDESTEWKIKYTPYFISRIIEKVGIRKSFCFISEIEQKIVNNPKMHPSIFENLLDKLIQDSIFTEEAIKKILEAELHRRSPKKSGNFASSPNADRMKSSSLTAAINPALSSPIESKKAVTSFDTDDRTTEVERKNSLSPGASTHHSPGSKTGKTPFKKNSLEVGELSVSEYSVNSNFLKDNYDEQEESSLRKSDLTNHMDSSLSNQRQLRTVSAERDIYALGKELEPNKGKFDNSLIDNVTNPRYLYKSELGPEIGDLSPNDNDNRIKLEYD